MTKFCDQCGTKLNDDDVFCHNCGVHTDTSKRKHSNGSGGGFINVITNYQKKQDARNEVKKTRMKLKKQEEINEQIRNEKSKGSLFYINGRDASLSVFEDHVEFDFTKDALKELLSGFGGVKKIYYAQMSSLQKRDATMSVLGTLEFEVPGMAQSGRYGRNENVIHYTTYYQNEANRIFEYVNKKLLEINSPKRNSIPTQSETNYMTQIKEAKELLDMGVLSQEEFDEVKEYYLTRIKFSD